MTAHTRKAVGSALILAFLLIYISVAVAIGDHLPGAKLVRLLYFLLVGTLWGAPLIPLISWMNRGR